MKTGLQWAKEPIKKYARFSGRACRREFWWFTLILFVALLAARALDSILFAPGRNIFTIAVIAVALVPQAAAAVRRLHDTGRPGWPYFMVAGLCIAVIQLRLILSAGGIYAADPVILQTLGILYMAGLAALVWMLAAPGTFSTNQYGPRAC